MVDFAVGGQLLCGHALNLSLRPIQTYRKRLGAPRGYIFEASDIDDTFLEHAPVAVIEARI